MSEDIRGKASDEKQNSSSVQHVFIIGAKSVGQYGDFETFVMNLPQQHKDKKNIKY